MFAVLKYCHVEVFRSIWPIRASQPDASEYLSMMILCGEIPAARQSGRTQGSSLPESFGGRGCRRQAHLESAAGSRAITVGGDRSAVGFNDAMRDRKAQARTGLARAALFS